MNTAYGQTISLLRLNSWYALKIGQTISLLRLNSLYALKIGTEVVTR